MPDHVDTTAVADPEAGTITRTIRIAAAIERVFELLTSSEAIEQWWGHPNQFPDGIAAGSLGVFHWRDITFPVRIDVVEPPVRFALTWGSGNDLDDEATQVAFTLTPDSDGTKLTVVESGFDRMNQDRRRAQMKDNVEGWNAVLDSFARYAASGGNR